MGKGDRLRAAVACAGIYLAYSSSMLRPDNFEMQLLTNMTFLLAHSTICHHLPSCIIVDHRRLTLAIIHYLHHHNETVPSKWNSVWLEHSIVGSLARALARWSALPRPVPAL